MEICPFPVQNVLIFLHIWFTISMASFELGNKQTPLTSSFPRSPQPMCSDEDPSPWPLPLTFLHSPPPNAPSPWPFLMAPPGQASGPSTAPSLRPAHSPALLPDSISQRSSLPPSTPRPHELPSVLSFTSVQGSVVYCEFFAVPLLTHTA